MVDKPNYFGSTKEECALFISEALFNLSEDYPHSGRVHYAFGRLGLSNLIPKSLLTIMPDKDHPYTRLEIQNRSEFRNDKSHSKF